MKLLVLSDTESPFLWDYYKPGCLKEYDLIISCGDLKPEYLTFLVTMGRAPVVYVHGNHDGHYAHRPPEGCVSIEDTVFTYGDLRLVGLGGSYCYSGGPHQYTEKQMGARVRKLAGKLRRAKGVDIVVTHAPVRGFGDEETQAHRGFEAFAKLLEKYKPRWLLHGHIHMNYGHGMSRIHYYGDTELINCYDRYVLELPDYDRWGKKIQA